MKTLQGAFLFPSNGRPLDAAGVVDAIEYSKMYIGGEIKICSQLGDTGFYCSSGERCSLELPYANDIRRRIERHELFEVESGTRAIELSVQFLSDIPRPVIRLLWPAHEYSSLSSHEGQSFYEFLVGAALRSKASYIVFALGKVDYVEDRFVEVDGRRIVDLSYTEDFGEHGFQEVWVATREGVRAPEGLDASRSHDVGCGLTAYTVE